MPLISQCLGIECSRSLKTISPKGLKPFILAKEGVYSSLSTSLFSCTTNKQESFRLPCTLALFCFPTPISRLNLQPCRTWLVNRGAALSSQVSLCLWGQEFTLPPANELQCWKNTTHMRASENMLEVEASLFAMLPMRTKVTREMAPQPPLFLKGLIWPLFAGMCLPFFFFFSSKLLPAEHAEAQNITSKGIKGFADKNSSCDR